jgi:hypothetical protein
VRKICIISLMLFYSSSVLASLKLNIEYSEAVDVFEILDGLSNWNEKGNSLYLTMGINLSDDDQKLVEKYKKIRIKYHKSLLQENENNLFSSLDKRGADKFDAFSMSFYNSKTVDQALGKLRQIVKPDDHKKVIEIIKGLKKFILPMTKQSISFRSHVKILSKNLKKGGVSSLMRKAEKFYLIARTKSLKKINVYFTWWPTNSEVEIDQIGNNIIIRQNPITLTEPPSASLIAPKIMAIISGLQPNQQKLNISSQFLAICNPSSTIPLDIILERPLSAVFGAILFRLKENKKEWNISNEWDSHPWVNTYARLIYPLVEQSIKGREGLAGGFISSAGKICSDLIKTLQFIGPLKK